VNDGCKRGSNYAGRKVVRMLDKEREVSRLADEK
jgi:hypothetical protein